MRNFLPLLFLPTLVRSKLSGRSLVTDSDYWRRAGQEPVAQECGTSRPPLDGFTIGSELVIGVNELCDFNGVLIEPSSEGMMNVGWLHEGNSVTFDVNLPSTGLYEMEVRVSSPTGDGAFTLTNRETDELYKTFGGVPETGSWQTWQTLSVGKVALPSGSSTLLVKSLDGGWNLLWIKLTMLSEVADEIRVSAGEINTPLEVQVDESSEGGENLAKIFTGDTLDFDVNLAYSGKYRLQLRISNARNQGKFIVANSKTGDLYGQVDFLPPTKDWYTWATVRVDDIYLPAGEHNLELIIVEGGFNIGWVGLDLMDIDTGMATPEDTSTTSVVIAARNYIESNGVAVDPYSNNVGGIDSAKDFMKYSVRVPTTGNYTITFSVASPDGEGLFSVVNWETNDVLGIVDEFPTTGGWHNWADVKISGVVLTRGMFPLRLNVIKGGWNIMLLTFDLEK